MPSSQRSVSLSNDGFRFSQTSAARARPRADGSTIERSMPMRIWPTSLLIAAGVLFSFSGAANAQQWPNRVVKFIVPFSAGGTTDILGRLMAQRLSEEYGQQFVVENKGGA